MDGQMKILSLCSGYGGLDMAVEQHFSAKTAYWSDVDKTACDVMAARFPDAQPIGDLTTLDLTMIHADVVTAGYPCQPFSNAGNRLGEKDERHLWPYIRNTISVLRPQYVVLENVAGHLSLGAATVVGDLAGLGYDAKWTVIRASDVQAPHQRKRWFCVATNTDGAGSSQTGTNDMAGEWEHHKRSIANANSEGLEGSKPTERHDLFTWGSYEPSIRRWERVLGRPAPAPVVDNRLSAVFVEWMMGLEKGHVTDIAPSRSKALACLGNGVVPQQAKRAMELLT
jgi:DNA (cytosine-5)-methyltransferase 1